MRSILLLMAAVLLLGCIAAPAQTPAPVQSVPSEGAASPQEEPAHTPQETQTPQDEGPAPSQPGSQPEEQPPAETAPAQPATSLKHGGFSYNSGIWKINGTLYESKQDAPKKAVILVPMLGQTRASYPISFIERLHDALPDAVILAIDPRGHGQSANAGSWESFDTDGFRDMKTDILNIKKNLQPRYPALTQLYVVGASMGSTSAINAAAQDKAITKVVMLSPGMEYRGVGIRPALGNYISPVFLVASSGDGYSMQSISDIEALSSRPELEKKIYSGSGHGTDMFAATAGSPDSLENVIIGFLN